MGGEAPHLFEGLPGSPGLRGPAAAPEGRNKGRLIRGRGYLLIFPKIQGGFCRQKHSHRNTDPKIGPQGRKPGRKPQENDRRPRKPTETQGPCPDLRGFCINALTVIRPTPKLQCAPEGALHEVSGAGFVRNRHYLLNRIRPRGFGAPPRPRRAEKRAD